MICPNLQRKRVERCDNVISGSRDAHQCSSLLWSCNGCQQHEPTAYTGANQYLASRKPNKLTINQMTNCLIKIDLKN